MAAKDGPAADEVSPLPPHGDGVLKGQKKGKKRKGNETPARRIRALERLLRNKGDKFAPGARRKMEEEVASLRALRDERARRTKEIAVAKQYRMVKFFERKKIERSLKQLEGKSDADSEKQRKELQRDLRYVTMYPREEKYVALYPSVGHTTESRAKVEEMRRRIDAVPEEEVDSKQPVADSGGDDFFLE